VALLVFWLVLLFASFGLFAPHNFVSAATLTLCAIAEAGAIGMVLELEKGFGGLIHVSPQPLRQVVAPGAIFRIDWIRIFRSDKLIHSKSHPNSANRPGRSRQAAG
jgi:hypothetical protein